MNQNFQYRQEKLQSIWHFDCQCEYCTLDQNQPDLRKRTDRLLGECADLATSFQQLQQTQYLLSTHRSTRASIALSRVVELEKFITRTQSILDGHEKYLASTLKNPTSIALAHISLLLPLKQLAEMLSKIIITLDATNVRLPILLEHHRRICMEQMTVSERWGTNDRWSADAMAMLELQHKFPAHAVMTVQQQEQLMHTFIREYMQSRGDTNIASLIKHRESEIADFGLTALFNKCKDELDQSMSED